MNGKALEGKRVFISGGCGDIAKAIATRFLASGARVALGDILTISAGSRIARALDPARTLYVRCDVTSSQSINRAMSRVERSFSGLDAVIACAGVVANEPFLKIEKSNWEKTLRVNLTGSMLLAQAGARLMIRNRRNDGGQRGTVIFTGSWVQSMPWPEGASYCASKAGQEMLAKVMAQELAPHGITCNIVAPGIVYAGLSKTIYDRDKVFQNRVNRTIPLGRLSTAEEIAGTFLYLASADGAYITGTTVLVDGGASLVRRDAE